MNLTGGAITTPAIRVDASDQVAEARRAAIGLARDLRFDEAQTARWALVVTECATNLWKHGGGGEILLSGSGPPEDHAMQVLALDKGPGMGDVGECMRDGYSTAGSSGTGLGAVARLSSEIQIYTERGKGTALLARIRNGKGNGKGHAATNPLEAGAVCVPKAGELVCGDGFATRTGENFEAVLVVDGLGHGQSAADAADAGRRAFAESRATGPVEAMLEVHAALRATRGAAAAVAWMDFERRQVRFAGIGNIAALIYDGRDTRHMASLPGIVGHDVRSVKEFTYAWPRGATLLLYSDGISTHWGPGAYDALLSRDPSLLAGVLYRDWSRGRDDATVLVIRERRAA
jgi:anti-sigma regulatory factor (Ser/Thr protein kinase)